MNGILAALLASPGMTQTGEGAVNPTPGSDKLRSNSCEAFGFNFYRKLVSTGDYQDVTDKNIAISPLSLASVLEMLRLGAAGESRMQLTAVLDSGQRGDAQAASLEKPEGLNSEGIALSVANSLWIDTQFPAKQDFLAAVGAEFGSVVFNIDFGQPRKAANRINGWISDNTKGHIKNLLSAADVPPVTAMIVANAVYFKGRWESPFDAKQTRQMIFHMTSGKDVSSQMMHCSGRFRFAEEDGTKVLELPYAGEAVSMVLLLPAAVAPGLKTLENQLSSRWFVDTLRKLRTRMVSVAVPRFTFSCQPANTIAILQALGLTRIFQPSIDFKPISDKGPLYVGLFKHRAWLEVNEQGTEAAAATATGIMAAVVMKPVEFIADRPFLFVIRDNATGTPLFVGRVSDPAVR